MSWRLENLATKKPISKTVKGLIAPLGDEGLTSNPQAASKLIEQSSPSVNKSIVYKSVRYMSVDRKIGAGEGI